MAYFPFFSSNQNKLLKNNSCKKYINFKLDLTPIIYNLSIDTIKYNTFEKIYVIGENFLPDNITSLLIGNKKINVNYINSNTIYFDIPSDLIPGVYYIIIKNNITLKTINTSGLPNKIVKYSNKVKFYVY